MRGQTNVKYKNKYISIIFYHAVGYLKRPLSVNIFVSGTEHTTWFQLARIWYGDRASGIKPWRSYHPDQERSDLPKWQLLGPRRRWLKCLRKKLDWAYVKNLFSCVLWALIHPCIFCLCNAIDWSTITKFKRRESDWKRE